MLGFKTFASAATTLAGAERLRRIHKGQFSPQLQKKFCGCFTRKPRVKDEVRIGSKLFDIFSVAA